MSYVTQSYHAAQADDADKDQPAAGDSAESGRPSSVPDDSAESATSLFHPADQAEARTVSFAPDDSAAGEQLDLAMVIDGLFALEGSNLN